MAHFSTFGARRGGSVSGPPSAPTVTLTPTGPSTASVALTVPSTNLGVAGVANYAVEYKRSADSTWTVVAATLTAAQFPYLITGLTAATPYDARARAANLYGELGPYSDIAHATTSAIVWQTVPTVTFIKGAGDQTYSYRGLVAPASGLTFTDNSATVPWPTGVVDNVSLGRLEYTDASGVISGSNGHIITADDSTSPSTFVSISNPQVTEADVGQNVILRFVISRASDGQPPISYSAATTSAGTATPNIDFTPFSQNGTINSGQSINLDVTVIGDAIPESDETVDMQVTLSWA